MTLPEPALPEVSQDDLPFLYLHQLDASGGTRWVRRLWSPAWPEYGQLATDSQGNVYTTESYEGKRLQKFVNKGMGSVTKQDQVTLWPR